MKYTKREARIINNTITMAGEIKKYYVRTQSWDIPEHLIVDGCEVGINSVFNEKQFIDYVKKMQKEIGKRTKKEFLKFAACSKILLTEDDIRIHRMVASKRSHMIIVLIRVMKAVELEEEDEEAAG